MALLSDLFGFFAPGGAGLITIRLKSNDTAHDSHAVAL